MSCLGWHDLCGVTHQSARKRCVLTPGREQRKLRVCNTPRSQSPCLFFWLSLTGIFCCNKTTTLHIVLLWFLWVILANYESKRIVGLNFAASWMEDVSGMGTPEWPASVWSEDSTVEAVPLTWKSGPASCSWCQVSLRWARQIRLHSPNGRILNMVKDLPVTIVQILSWTTSYHK